MTYKVFYQFFVFLLFGFMLSACANSAYVTKAPKSYPHEKPNEKQSDGSYITDKGTNSGTNSLAKLTPMDNSGITSSSASVRGNIEHNWAIADNGREYKIGNPYKVGGKWYKPHEVDVFTQSGIASWYGPNFHLKKTANGGIFDKNIASAAHKTLPLPSVVRVTNKDNGKSIIVKVNDRGPYSKSRVIDLSQKAAQLLDFEKNGTANVNIVYLAKESQQLKAMMQTKKSSTSPTRTYDSVKAVPVPSLSTTQTPIVKKVLPPKPVIGSRTSLIGEMPYKLQVGAFASQSNAEELKQALSEKYTHVRILPSNRFYKVQIGFTSKVEAENELPTIRYNLGFDSAFVISK